MRRRIIAAILAASASTLAVPADAGAPTSARRAQERQQAQIPVCSHKLGALSIVEPDRNWWSQLGLSSPEAIIRLFVMRSGCFTLVNRGRGLASRNIERELAEQGELQEGSNIGRGQIRAADYFLVPDIISQNRNAGGTNVGGVLGGLGRVFGGRTVGAIAGGVDIHKKEANVVLSLVNARTTEEERVTEGYAKKTDVGFRVGAGGFLGGGWGAVGGGSYENSEIGQVIVLAYLKAYSQMVRELGGLPDNPSEAAPPAREPRN
jgi:curli biogenesis system outer membrane secretion channel CsgG